MAPVAAGRVGHVPDFSQAAFTGTEVSFGSARFTGGAIHFGGAEFGVGAVDFHDAEFAGGEVAGEPRYGDAVPVWMMRDGFRDGGGSGGPVYIPPHPRPRGVDTWTRRSHRW
ncbi:hypothetical protein GCM10010402_08190 [Actinomadura luteofluorescens]|uniref:hypothetical protein n=1 Tax=Actinomadura luteofluorescens TaxID=46163 RepID=UPI0021645E7B|nr:hypothetical protein [Actinomadura glauciflava]MCR3738374.1 hypothetical protein [Actinomadura glauciflava]